MERVKPIRKFTVRAVVPGSLSALEELAGNLRWSWHEPTKRLFEHIDPELWRSSRRDPVAFLGEVDPARLDELAADGGYVEWAERERHGLREYLSEPRWFQSLGTDAPRTVAYFSPEFGITAALPQYSGGLGILAGDHLKAASDLGVPLIGVGLFYKAGYFAQSISPDGWQQERYPVLDPDGLPLSVLRRPDGSPVQVTLALPDDESLHARVWKAAVGRITLLLLDTDIPANTDDLRSVTDRLYGGGGEHRLLQELLLGIGGARAVRAFTELSGGPAPDVFHMNEGHAGFLGLERIATHIAEGLSFAEALQLVRAGTVFTTHTPVPAGIDRFDRALVERYLTSSLLPGVDPADALALGVEPGADPATSPFNMAVMGLRLAQRANGVSKLHGQVSRRMFGDLWPGFDSEDVPITSITNGVHAPTWTDPALLGLAEATLGTADTEHADWASGSLSAAEFWGVKRRMRLQLVEDARRRLAAAWSDQHAGRAGAAVGVARARPRHADRRVRPPRAHVQAPHPHAQRPRAAEGDPHEPRATRAVRDRRQVPPRRRRGQAPHPAARAVRPAARAARAHRVPARLRHGHGRDALPGLRRVAEQPAASARGVRHLGHEGRDERRPQPVDPRRLVGRVRRRRLRLGDPVGGCRGRRRRARRPRGGRALRAARAPGGDAVLRARRRRRARSSGCVACAARSRRSRPSSAPTAW